MLKPVQLKISLLIFCAFLFASYAFPLHIHPYRVYYQDALVILGLLFMVAVWANVPVLVVRIPYVVLLPVAVVFIIALQSCCGIILYPAEMIFPILYLVLFAISMVCGATIAMQEDGVRILASALAACLLCSGIVGVGLQHIQLLHMELTPWVVSLNWNAPLRPFANFAQANTLALVLCFALASLWHVHCARRFTTTYTMLLGLILLWGLALTESRIGWLIVPVFVALNWSSDKGTRRQLLTCLAIFIVFVLIVPLFLRAVGGLAESIGNRAGQTEVRLILWQQALAMSLDHPWSGVGWFQFGINQVRTAANFRPTEYSEYAHNILLNLAAEIGWPSTVMIIAVAGLWIRQCCVGNWHSSSTRYFSLLLTAIGIHSMVEYPMWYGFFLFPVGLIMGALHTRAMGWKIVSVRRCLPIAFVLFSIAAAAVVTADYIRVAEGFTAIRSIQGGDKSYLSNIKKPEFTLFPQFYDYFHVVEIKLNFNMPSGDLIFLNRISERFGFAPILDRLAIASAQNQQPAEALAALTKIQRIDTGDYPAIYRQWAGYAQNTPKVYGEIFKQMPPPEK